MASFLFITDFSVKSPHSITRSGSKESNDSPNGLSEAFHHELLHLSILYCFLLLSILLFHENQMYVQNSRLME